MRSMLVSMVALLPVAALPGCAQPCADSGTVCSIVGTGLAGYGGDGEKAVDALVYAPTDVTLEGAGPAYYVSDWNNHRVRRVDADGVIATTLGAEFPGDGDPDGAERTPAGGAADTVRLNHPVQVEWNPDTERLLAPSWHNHRIREVDVDNNISRVVVANTTDEAGNGANAGYAGDGGPAAAALMKFPVSMAVGPDGDIFIADQGNLRIRRVAADYSLIETIAGSGDRGLGGDGGDPMLATFNFPTGGQPEPGAGIEIAPDGAIYLADSMNNCIRRIDLDGARIDRVAGTSELGFAGDGGLAVDAMLGSPRDIELGPDGRLYFADTKNHAIRAIDLGTGTIETVLGDGTPGTSEEEALVADVQLNQPYGIEFDGDGALLVADTYNHRILRVTP
jgi:DNA-binding beta-propeller fold protein YncE